MNSGKHIPIVRRYSHKLREHSQQVNPPSYSPGEISVFVSILWICEVEEIREVSVFGVVDTRFRLKVGVILCVNTGNTFKGASESSEEGIRWSFVSIQISLWSLSSAFNLILIGNSEE